MAAKRKQTGSEFANYFSDLLAERDRMLKEIGREEGVDRREELEDRMRLHVAESSEALICEALDRALRIEFGLPVMDFGESGADED